jgi:hypothetical protein
MSWRLASFFITMIMAPPPALEPCSVCTSRLLSPKKPDSSSFSWYYPIGP